MQGNKLFTIQTIQQLSKAMSSYTQLFSSDKIMNVNKSNIIASKKKI